MKSDLKLEKVFLVGDFNAYYAEKPIQKIVAAGYTDLSEQVSEKTGKYTYAYTVKDESGNTNGGSARSTTSSPTRPRCGP